MDVSSSEFGKRSDDENDDAEDDENDDSEDDYDVRKTINDKLDDENVSGE